MKSDDTPVPRPFVMAAAVALEVVLRRNDTKGDWMNLNPWELWQLHQEEHDELGAEMATVKIQYDRLQAEALDAALTALFLWQSAGGCPDFGHRGTFDPHQARLYTT